jgi:hypothetical protein
VVVEVDMEVAMVVMVAMVDISMDMQKLRHVVVQ